MPPSYHFLIGPAVAVGMVLVLGLLARWVFGSGAATVARRPRAAGSDYGLLLPVASVRTRGDAEMLRELLAAHQIRGTISPSAPPAGSGPGQQWQVLVFREDAAAGRRLVSHSAPPSP